jgi:hypothetical protein
VGGPGTAKKKMKRNMRLNFEGQGTGRDGFTPHPLKAPEKFPAAPQLSAPSSSSLLPPLFSYHQAQLPLWPKVVISHLLGKRACGAQSHRARHCGLLYGHHLLGFLPSGPLPPLHPSLLSLLTNPHTGHLTTTTVVLQLCRTQPGVLTSDSLPLAAAGWLLSSTTCVH